MCARDFLPPSQQKLQPRLIGPHCRRGAYAPRTFGFTVYYRSGSSRRVKVRGLVHLILFPDHRRRAARGMSKIKQNRRAALTHLPWNPRQDCRRRLIAFRVKHSNSVKRINSVRMGRPARETRNLHPDFRLAIRCMDIFQQSRVDPDFQIFFSFPRREEKVYESEPKKDTDERIPVWATQLLVKPRGNSERAFLISFTRSIDMPDLVQADRSRGLTSAFHSGRHASSGRSAGHRPDLFRFPCDFMSLELRQCREMVNLKRSICATLKGHVRSDGAQKGYNEIN